MMHFGPAVASVLTAVRPLPTETISLDEADARVLAVDVKTRINLPRFDQSAMDGYAVLLADVQDAVVAPVALRLTGEMPAGCARRLPLKPGCVVKVFTGSMIPSATEAVVMQEDTRTVDGGVEVRRSPAPGQYIRRCGEERRRGDPLLSAGTEITPPVLGLLAANGIDHVRVRRLPDVALVTLGDEIAAPGAPLAPGQIRDANGPALTAALRRLGVRRLRRSSVGDDPRALRRVLSREMKRCDAVITVGGASVGDHDHVEAVRLDLGVDERFNRVAMKPGKPNVFGVAPGGCLMFGLPGNPVSALVSFHHFVAPALSCLTGRRPDAPGNPEAVLAAPIRVRSDRLEWVRGVAGLVGGQMTVTPTVGQESHMLSGLAAANCLIEVPGEARDLPTGARVRISTLSW